MQKDRQLHEQRAICPTINSRCFLLASEGLVCRDGAHGWQGGWEGGSGDRAKAGKRNNLSNMVINIVINVICLEEEEEDDEDKSHPSQPPRAY
jgi:hypothetical protein